MKLEIRNLTKTYGQIQALKGVTFTLENGIYGLLGPNGAGKSTLIHLLTDNIKREKGTILWKRNFKTGKRVSKITWLYATTTRLL